MEGHREKLSKNPSSSSQSGLVMAMSLSLSMMPWWLSFLSVWGVHAKNLLSIIIKMLVECLVFLVIRTYALPVWGTAIHKDSLSWLTHLYNCGIQLTCGLCKYDRVSQHAVIHCIFVVVQYLAMYNLQSVSPTCNHISRLAIGTHLLMVWSRKPSRLASLHTIYGYT